MEKESVRTGHFADCSGIYISKRKKQAIRFHGSFLAGWPARGEADQLSTAQLRNNDLLARTRKKNGMEENGPDLKKVIQAGHLAKVSLYRQLLQKVANGATLCNSELRTLRGFGAELEALDRGGDEPRALDSAPAQNITSLSRADLARHVFRVSPQSISNLVLNE